MLVHSEVIDDVVLMAAGALEDRRKVKRGDAEVAEFVENALQVATHEVADRWRRAPRLGVEGVIRRIAIIEALWKNLVENRVTDPRGCREWEMTTRLVLEPRLRLGGIGLQALW